MGQIEFAVKGLVFCGNKFLAVHKAKIKSPKFELPGGKMNFGETAEQTIIREMKEEVGLDVTPVKLVDTWNYLTETNQITGIIYLCVIDKPQHIVLSEEHDIYEWLGNDSESLEKMNSLFNPQMLRWDWDELVKTAETAL